MLPYKNRIIDRKDFLAVHRFGRFFSLGVISLKIQKNRLKVTRIGLSVGLKFSKKAVERNRVKRQIRAIVSQDLNQIKGGFDIIIMIQKGKKKNISNFMLIKDWKKFLVERNLIIK